MSLEDFDPLETNPKEASLSTLIRGTRYMENEKDLNLKNLKILSETKDEDAIISRRKAVQEYSLKLDEFYKEIDRREKNYNRYDKDSTIYC